jgi:phosphatidylglycerol:prolipoprotein diacylglycerol transferase
MLFIGRIGCFANGCCEGLPTESSLGVRFPFRPDTPVWPSQLFESAASLLIGGMLLILEQRRRRHPEAYARATLFPTFLISYGAYRIAFDFLRSGNRTLGLQTGQYSGIIACLVGVFWLAKSFTRRVDITMS